MAITMSEHNNFYNVREAELNTKIIMQNILHMRDAESVSAEDRRLWEKITRFMDGEPNLSFSLEFWYTVYVTFFRVPQREWQLPAALFYLP
mgnify:CR=1 FL=1